MSVSSVRDIELLHPKVKAVVEQLMQEFDMLLITETYRTVERQDYLYSLGRTVQGNIVTNAKGSWLSSQHQWGIAFDFAYNQSGNLYPNDFMLAVGNRAKELGLAWGGDWTGFVDKPHIYLGDWGTSTTQLINTYGTYENFKKTWVEEPINKKGEQQYMEFYTVDGQGPVILCNIITGKETPISHPDELLAYNETYKNSIGNGQDIPCKDYQSKAPYHIRRRELMQREGIK